MFYEKGKDMSVQINNLSDNSNIKVIAEAGKTTRFTILEHQQDLSPYSAMQSYFNSKMNVKKRQVLCKLNGSSVRIQSGAMQWISGKVKMETGVEGVKGFLGKAVKGAVTGESAVKPIYTGEGHLCLEPTWRYLLLEDVSQWGAGIVLDDGLFLACDDQLKETIVKRQNISSALLGGEGLFNLSLSGDGIVALESPVPREELVEFNLVDDVVKIDGNMAIAWSSTLQFTVEKSTKSLIGSGISGEGFVNVFRGTGKILMAPTIPGTTDVNLNGPEASVSRKSSSAGVISSVGSSLFG